MITDEQIMCALVGQVARTLAMIPGPCTEQNVTTYITRPMWNAFLRAGKIPENSKPTEWNGCHTIRVYGSKTVIVESDELWSFSKPAP